MTGRSVVRRRPFVVVEIVLAVLLALGGLGYAWQVSASVLGAWTTANALLAVATVLGVVLAVHGTRDLLRALGDADWPRSRRMALVGALWRLGEIALVVGFVVLGLLSGVVAADLAQVGQQEGAGAVTMALIVSLVVEAGIVGVLVLMIAARALVTGDGRGGDATGSGTDSAAGDRGRSEGGDGGSEGGTPEEGDEEGYVPSSSG